MVAVQSSVRIECPPDEVFAFIARGRLV